tara:strand:+ start:389 stop:910 length:522 start_codon:yes stop_codon:yes gene_type:complete
MKNLCSYCGTPSGTNNPFPKKEIDQSWLSVICPRCYTLEHIKLLENDKNYTDEFRESVIAQSKSDRKRKMVGNAKIQLVFWFNDNDSIYGFQYIIRDSEFSEVAFTWSEEKGGYIREIVTQRRMFETNTLKMTKNFKTESFIQLFEESGGNLKKEYRDLVLEKLHDHHDSQGN